MKSDESPDATDLGIARIKKRTPKLPKSFFHQHKALKIAAFACLVAFAVCVYVLANRHSTLTLDGAEMPLAVGRKIVQVEVLDGVGNMKVAQRMTDLIRRKGYDVVEMKRNGDGIAEKTIIFDHSGNYDTAKKLAKELGVAENKVFQKLDKNLYLDITVIVGKDYATLKDLQPFRERTMQ
jgi:hypothetical protein